MKKKLIYIFSIVVIFTFSFYKVSVIYSENKIKDSSIYKLTKEYSKTGKLTTRFDFTGKEKTFFEGLKAYDKNNIKEAQILFKRIQYSKGVSPELLFYTNFYLNECEIETTGKGNFYYIEKALNIMKGYLILSNEVDMIWQMISSVAVDNQSRKKIIDLLEVYIKNAHKLTLENQLKVKAFVAIMRMTNEEYGKSIYTYYDILDQCKKIKDEDTRSKLQIKSYEYLGNIYFILEEFESAAEYYNKAISIRIKDPLKNASSKYGAYVNRTESYIEMKNYEKAEESSMETEKIISYLPEDVAIGVKVFRYKNLSLLESRKKNFEKAKEYYKLSLKYLSEDENGAFLNGIMYIELAHCEMLYLQKKYDEAIEKLNYLLKKDLEEKWGFDTSIYGILSKIYRETNQIEKYLEAEKNISQIEKEFNKNLKEDYIKFVKNGYLLDQLRNQEKSMRMKLFGLAGIVIFAFVCIIAGIKKIKTLDETNYIDFLTNAYNRKYMDYLSRKNLKSSVKMAIVMIDIDYFKNYNDFYGHPSGDMVIKKIAEIMKNNIRKDDVLIRYGGEEFLIILKDADFDIFKEIYERITQNLHFENIPHEKSQVSDRVTLSVGVCFREFKEKLDLKESIKEADEMLYLSKKYGRNRYTAKN